MGKIFWLVTLLAAVQVTWGSIEIPISFASIEKPAKIPSDLFENWDRVDQYYFEPFFLGEENTRDLVLANQIISQLGDSLPSFYKTVESATSIFELPSVDKFKRISSMIIGEGAFACYPEILRGGIVQKLWNHIDTPIISLSMFISANCEKFQKFKSILEAISNPIIRAAAIKIALGIDSEILPDIINDRLGHMNALKIGFHKAITVQDVLNSIEDDKERAAISQKLSNTKTALEINGDVDCTPQNARESLIMAIALAVGETPWFYDGKGGMREIYFKARNKLNPTATIMSLTDVYLGGTTDLNVKIALQAALDCSCEFRFLNEIFSSNRAPRECILMRKSGSYYLPLRQSFRKRFKIPNGLVKSYLSVNPLDNLISEVLERYYEEDLDMQLLVEFARNSRERISIRNAAFLCGLDWIFKEKYNHLFRSVDANVALEIALGINLGPGLTVEKSIKLLSHSEAFSSYTAPEDCKDHGNRLYSVISRFPIKTELKESNSSNSSRSSSPFSRDCIIPRYDSSEDLPPPGDSLRKTVLTKKQMPPSTTQISILNMLPERDFATLLIHCLSQSEIMPVFTLATKTFHLSARVLVEYLSPMNNHIKDQKAKPAHNDPGILELIRATFVNTAVPTYLYLFLESTQDALIFKEHVKIDADFLTECIKLFQAEYKVSNRAWRRRYRLLHPDAE